MLEPGLWLKLNPKERIRLLGSGVKTDKLRRTTYVSLYRVRKREEMRTTYPYTIHIPTVLKKEMT